MEQITMNDINREIFDAETKKLKAEYKKYEKKLQRKKGVKGKEEEIKIIEGQLENIRKKADREFSSKRKTYVRYCRKIVNKMGNLVDFLDINRNPPKEINLTTSQASIYYVLLSEVNESTIIKYWIEYGTGDENNNKGLNSLGIVAMYERLQELINQDAMKRNADIGEINQWMTKFGEMIDYENAKKVKRMYDLLDKLDLEGQGINHQINYGSFICSEGRIQEYATISYGQIPSAMPQCVEPQNYEKFATLEQFYAGLEEYTKMCYKKTKEDK